MINDVDDAIEPIDMARISGGGAWQRCVVGASIATAPATLLGAAAGTVVPGVGTVTGAGVGALWGMAAGCAAGVATRPR
jgi:hypothetical protein